VLAWRSSGRRTALFSKANLNILLLPSQKSTGTHHPDFAEAEALEARYNLDAAIIQADADKIALRTHLFVIGGAILDHGSGGVVRL
jgi:hypothetical protein